MSSETNTPLTRPAKPPQTPPVVLVFAATDPSSGAGIQADLLTLASLGCHPLTVITAITVQDTLGVESIHPVDAEIVEAQARTILEDIPVAAFKVGVVGSIENIVTIAEIVADYPEIPLILDPVLASGRGDSFGGEGLLNAMRELLLPQTTVITPNTHEARQLCHFDESEIVYVDDDELDENGTIVDQTDDDEPLPGEIAPRETLDEDNETLVAVHPKLLSEKNPITPDDEYEQLAAQLMAMGAQHVLITGTHAQTKDVCNRLFGEDGLMQSMTWPRLPGSYHGSGCTLASALAAGIACGAELQEASQEAQEYTWQTLSHGYRPGMGQFVPDRLFWAREEDGETSEPAAPTSDA
jgi:hydroxymethylpyrimidine/phosphomethylpyrimidine kinase